MRRSTGQLPLAFKIGKVILAIMTLISGTMLAKTLLAGLHPRRMIIIDFIFYRETDDYYGKYFFWDRNLTTIVICFGVIMLIIWWAVGLWIGGAFMPTFHRMHGLWWPRALPRIRHRGFTLIELLIVIAIVAILMPPFAKLAQQSRMASERESLSRESLALAQDEFAWLRSQSALPAERGSLPIAPEVAAMHRVVAPMAKVEISPTSGPLVQVRVTVDLASKGIRTPVSLAALIAPRKEVKP